ncbi:MAG: acyloxyacyl hydrolase [Ignavibacteriae bacterium]|nr:acyloxyacyl hydrolase [Ignavibacteriota bacterium]
MNFLTREIEENGVGLCRYGTSEGSNRLKKHVQIVLVLLFLLPGRAFPQYAVGDHWYDNPLGFEPLKLHTSMGFIVPAGVVGICLLVTENNPALSQRLEVFNELGCSWGYKYPGTFLFKNSTGLNYLLRDFMSMGLEFNVLYPTDNFNRTLGLSVIPFARFYFLNNDRMTLFFESGGGLSYFFNEFPQPTDRDARVGTTVNGMTKYGIGTEIRACDSYSILFGLRHVHVSNGNTSGVERNPSHDSNGFYIGLAKKFP